MILGSGLLARAFEQLHEDGRVLVFASGVSNSSTAREADYDRERNLLLEQRGTKARLVYFSTCSLFDPLLGNAGYIRHKLRMEELIRQRFPDHLILRLPNVVGHTPNPHTLCNHIRNCILAGRTLAVQTKACRYIMGVDLVAEACTPLITAAKLCENTVNVCLDQPVPVPELVGAMEQLLQAKAKVQEVDSGSCYAVDNGPFKQSWRARAVRPWPTADYWRGMLASYYGDRAN
ncbi:MAG: NAD(P)-dependent oxidoreductase [Flavobacteriales bacterium]|nr:NAD(P)-dependent oxidoreductase [Flavobacteriales bacterium]